MERINNLFRNPRPTLGLEFALDMQAANQGRRRREANTSRLGFGRIINDPQ